MSMVTNPTLPLPQGIIVIEETTPPSVRSLKLLSLLQLKTLRDTFPLSRWILLWFTDGTAKLLGQFLPLIIKCHVNYTCKHSKEERFSRRTPRIVSLPIHQTRPQPEKRTVDITFLLCVVPTVSKNVFSSTSLPGTLNLTFPFLHFHPLPLYVLPSPQCKRTIVYETQGNDRTGVKTLNREGKPLQGKSYTVGWRSGSQNVLQDRTGLVVCGVVTGTKSTVRTFYSYRS